MKNVLTPTAIAFAVASLFSSTSIAADYLIDTDISNNQVVEGTASDTIRTQNNNPPRSFTNSGTITGFGTLEVGYGRIFNNTGLINVSKYTSATDSSSSILKNTGTIYVNESNFGVSLDNAGKVIVRGNSLNITDRNVVIREGSVITDESGKRLSSITIKHESQNIHLEVLDNAVLEADTIYVDPHNQGLIIKGKVIGDHITLKSYLNFAPTAEISGRLVEIDQIDQINNDADNDHHGGLINATEKLTFLSYANLEDTTVTSPLLVAPNSTLNLSGKTQLNGLKRLELGSTFSVIGNDVSINSNNHIDEVVFLAKENVSNGPRIQNQNGQSLSIGTLTVNKSTNANGDTITSNLIDKSTSATDGTTSFKIDSVDIAEGAKLTAYSDKPVDAQKTNLELGTVTVGKDAEFQLGWRSSDYTEFASKNIQQLTLAENAQVTIDKRPGNDAPIEANVQNITFAGNEAIVETTLTGSSTNVVVNSDVTGSVLSDVKSQNFDVFIEKTAKDILTVNNVSNETKVTVTGTSQNNSGNATEDLQEVAESVTFGTNKEVTVVQQASDINDGATGTATQNADGTHTVGNVQVTANSNINGIAEMTALGLHIWRNEINDMNKRLGELRDSSDEANGVWTRVYNGKAKFGSQSITNKYTAFQFGYDRQVADGLWLGGALSWTDGNNDFAVGGGDNSLAAFTAYGSKLWDNGMFVDVTGKFGRIKNEFDINLASGHSSGDYHANAVSVSAEAGWRLYPLKNNFFVEPQVEMMYGHVESVDYSTSTGVKVNQDSAETLIGRAGFVMGFKCPADRGNAYVRASVLHDWKGDTNFKFSKNGTDPRAISESLGGTWYEYGVGANFNATKQLHIYADVEAANGGEVDTDYRVNVGMRYSF